MLIVVYAKIIDDKEQGVKLGGVYLGGLVDDQQAADKLSRDLVNTIKGGTIITRTYNMADWHQLPRVMSEAEALFRKKEQDMIVASQIINRSSKRR
jgi:hypothetical protein